jgi:hypothetical protein
VDLGSDSGTKFVHEAASEVVGSREGGVGVIEGIGSGGYLLLPRVQACGETPRTIAKTRGVVEGLTNGRVKDTCG